VFPFGLLLFALPLGDRLAPALQEFTARFAVRMLALSDVPAVLGGHVISIADDSWRVSEACGGINYLVASLIVGYLYAGAVYHRWAHRVAFLAASALVPIAGNGLRVYTTILLDYLGATWVVSGMEHELYGVLVFAIITGVLFITCGRWREEPFTGDGSMSRPEVAAPVASSASTRRTVLYATVGMLLVASGPVSVNAFWLPHGPGRPMQQNPPAISPPWKAVDGDLLEWLPRFVAPQSEFVQTYKSGNHVVKLYVASYGADQPGVKLTSRANVLYGEPWWPDGEGQRTIVLEGQSFQVSERVLRSPTSSLLVWSWYQIDGRFTGNDYVGKLLLAKARLFRSSEGSAAIAVATEEQPGLAAAAVLRAFVGHVSLLDTARSIGEHP
jgi:EpsI family protein